MPSIVSGEIYRRLPDGSIGSTIAGVKLTFLKEDHSETHTTTSNAAGHYTVTLPFARYYLQATHVDFEDYTTAPAFVVAIEPAQVCNIFLRAPRVTTVFVVRHGEKLNPSGGGQSEPLSPAGQQRAEKLREVLFRAGITRIHSTDFVRTKGTVLPLAQSLGIPVELYDTPANVAARVLAESAGDVSLVVGHADTVSQVISSVGPSVSFSLLTNDDFDNLFVVSRAGRRTHVVNLQYGVDTTPTISGGTTEGALTVLLVGPGGPGGPGAEPARLTHAARRARVKAIFARPLMSAMVSPLAASLSLSVSPYDSSGLLGLVNGILREHGHDTVVVSGPRDDLGAIIKLLGGSPAIIYTNDVHHMVVLTRFSTGTVRVIPTLL